MLATALSAAGLLTAQTAAAGTYRLVYTFKGGSDGAAPSARLIAIGGMLYGTTFRGGSQSKGTVFKVDPTTGAESVVYAFKGGSDGANPQSGLIEVGGMLFGTAKSGGSTGFGTVFKVDPSTGAQSVVYSFTGGSDGGRPSGNLINVGGILYGMTLVGGSAGAGTVYKVNLTKGTERVVYSFKGGSDGAGPQSSPIAINGTLFGITVEGGSLDLGTVFKVNPISGAESVVYSFQGGSDGAHPGSGLLNIGGVVYGTTPEGGGTLNLGTVFQVDTATGAESVVHSFKGGRDGAFPFGSLINLGGRGYGTTTTNGLYNRGTLFRINPATGFKSVVYNFKGGTDGDNPVGLTNVSGTLFGATLLGGSADAGTIFAFTP